MLEILIDNTALDLPSDIAINIVMENPFMAEDRIPAPYSLSFEIPGTAHNLALFGFPNRLGVYNNSYTGFSKKNATIRYNSLSLLKGHITLTNVSSTLKINFVGIDFNDNIRIPLYKLDLGRQYFPGEYDDVDFTDPSNFAYSYLQWANSLVNTSRQDYIAAPLVVASENQPYTVYTPMFGDLANRYEYIDKYTWKLPFRFNDLEHINAYNVKESTFLIEKKSSASYFIPIRKAVSSIFPVFRVGYILDKIFSSLLLNNPFSTGDLFDLVMPTYFFSQWKPRVQNDALANTDYPPMVSNPRPNSTTPFPSQPYVELADFLPDYNANDFVVQLLNLFCATMIPYRGKLRIQLNNSILSAIPTADWTSKLIDIPELYQEPGKEYEYGYRDDSDSEIEEQIDATVATIYDMISKPFTLDADKLYQEIFHITSTGQIIRKYASEVKVNRVAPNGETTEVQIQYTLLKNNFGGNKATSEVKFDVKSGIRVLPDMPARYFQNTENNPTVAGSLKEYQAPAFLNIDRSVRPSEVHLTFLQGVYHVHGDSPGVTTKYPILSSHKMPGEPHNKTLAWNATNGLYDKYHIDFKSWIEKNKLKLKGDFLLSYMDLHNLDISEKVHVNGRNFFIEKLQFTIYKDHISPVITELTES